MYPWKQLVSDGSTLGQVRVSGKKHYAGRHECWGHGTFLPLKLQAPHVAGVARSVRVISGHNSRSRSKYYDPKASEENKMGYGRH